MLKVAVIGLGNMGRHHVRHYSEMSNVDLVAVCDRGHELVSKCAADYGVRPYTDLQTLLEKEQLDAVSLASPTYTHYELGKQILNAGIHLLIEKPIATTVIEADELIKIAKEKALVLTVGHIERFNPAVLRMKSLINDGLLGKITSIVTRRVGVFPVQIEDANVMLDLAVHDIDITNYLLDALPDSVLGHTGVALTGGRPDYAECLLRYGDASAFIQVNWITPVRVRESVITGTKGYAVMNYMDQTIHFTESQYDLKTLKNGEVLPSFKESLVEHVDIESSDALRAELDQFVTAIQGGDLIVTAEQARDSLRIVLDM